MIRVYSSPQRLQSSTHDRTSCFPTFLTQDSNKQYASLETPPDQPTHFGAAPYTVQLHMNATSASGNGACTRKRTSIVSLFCHNCHVESANNGAIGKKLNKSTLRKGKTLHDTNQSSNFASRTQTRPS